MDYDYKVGDKILIVKNGIIRKAESPKEKEPWTITTVQTNGTIRVTRRTKSERINAQTESRTFFLITKLRITN